MGTVSLRRDQADKELDGTDYYARSGGWSWARKWEQLQRVPFKYIFRDLAGTISIPSKPITPKSSTENEIEN